MIKIEGLSKFFRTEEVETIALNNVSLEVKDGEFVAIMGPSGCGKSTLLNILGLLDNPTSGDYYLAGKEVGHLKEKERTQVRKGNIGFVFQSFNLIDELNVFENVELPLTYLKVKAGERKQMVNDILKRMNISHRAGHFPQQLSGGQQQRVAIARAVVSNPKIILADEPTCNLDPNRSLEIMMLSGHINRIFVAVRDQLCFIILPYNVAVPVYLHQFDLILICFFTGSGTCGSHYKSARKDFIRKSAKSCPELNFTAVHVDEKCSFCGWKNGVAVECFVFIIN